MQCLSVLVGIYDERWYKEALLSSTNAVIFSQLLCNSNDLNSANRKWEISIAQLIKAIIFSF